MILGSNQVDRDRSLDVGLDSDQDEVTVFNGALTSIVEVASSSITYVGEAPVGTDKSTAGWRILRIDKSVSGSTDFFFAGVGVYDQVWNNRAGLTYNP